MTKSVYADLTYFMIYGYKLVKNSDVLEINPFSVKLTGVDLRNLIGRYPEEIYNYKIVDYGILDCINIHDISKKNIEPLGRYKLSYFFKTENGDSILGVAEFSTPDIKLTTVNPKVVNKGVVVLAAEVNLLDGMSNAGFEWRKVDAPDVVPSKTGEAVVYGGRMEGIVKNLDASSYYKVRPYYMAASGKEYYGEWIGFDPSDFSYFEPTVHTYDYVEVVDGVATFVGYAMQGSDDIISQGFEYWNDGTAHSNCFYAPSSGVKTVTATGQRMIAQVDGLSGGTTYGYRAFVKTQKGTTYGEECQFTTPVSNDIEIIEVVHKQTVREGVYTLSGVKVANSLGETKQLPSGIYIVNGKKMVVR